MSGTADGTSLYELFSHPRIINQTNRNYYALIYLNWCPHFDCHSHNVSAIVLSGLLQAYDVVGNLRVISNRTCSSPCNVTCLSELDYMTFRTI